MKKYFKDFKKYFSFRILYKIIMLLFMLLCFYLTSFLCISKVSALEVDNYKYTNRTSFPATTWFDTGGDNYYNQFFVFNGGQPNYIFISYCGTGVIRSPITNDIQGDTSFVNTYNLNTSCITSNASSSTAYLYVLVFRVNSVYDAGGGQKGIYFDTFVSSTSSTVYLTFLSVEVSTSNIYENASSNDETNSKIDDVNDNLQDLNDSIISSSSSFTSSSCGIICKLKNLPSQIANSIGGFFTTLLNGIIDGLKDLFIPASDYFSNWLNEIKTFFEAKLGFLVYPFTLIINFVNRFLSISDTSNFVINIPAFTLPNFEISLWEATTFDFNDVLNNSTFNSIWHLYLNFIDVFLILNFVNLCYTKYCSIFGGNSGSYEIYSDSDERSV